MNPHFSGYKIHWFYGFYALLNGSNLFHTNQALMSVSGIQIKYSERIAEKLDNSKEREK